MVLQKWKQENIDLVGEDNAVPVKNTAEQFDWTNINRGWP